jgi:tRNA (cytosine38-C5)-methyltransferase
LLLVVFNFETRPGVLIPRCLLRQSTRGRFANGVEGVTGEVLTSIPGMEHPARARPLFKYIMPLTPEEQQQLIIPSDLLAKQSSWCIDIATVDDTSSSCFTKSYPRYHKGTGSVLLMPDATTTMEQTEAQETEAESSETKCPGDENDKASSPSKRARTAAEPQRTKQRELLEDPSARQFDPTWYTKYQGRLRYFSPRELLNLFGFDEHFSFPVSCARKKQYEMIGNSLNAVVASELLRLLFSNDV